MPVWTAIDDPEALEGKEKIYSAAEEVWFPYAFISSPGHLPASLEPREAKPGFPS